MPGTIGMKPKSPRGDRLALLQGIPSPAPSGSSLPFLPGLHPGQQTPDVPAKIQIERPARQEPFHVCGVWASGDREQGQSENETMSVQDELRDAAGSCLELAQTTTDPNARTLLSTLAQKFLELAGASPAHQVLTTLLEEFNEAQMLHPLPPPQST
jgi:hypothetical protein